MRHVSVGTAPGKRFAGGAFGTGLSRNVCEAYDFVRDNWDPGDELFVFGFSRGAYTARSLCGFLRLVGQLDDPRWVDVAYLWYRLSRARAEDRRPSRTSQLLGALVEPRIAHRVDVTFLGVFDTVGVLGIPFRLEDLATDLGIDAILDRLDLGVLGNVAGLIEDRVRRPIEGFHDTELSPHVRNA